MNLKPQKQGIYGEQKDGYMVHPMKSLNAENRGGFEGMERIRQVHFQKTGIKNPPTTSARGFLSCKHLLQQPFFQLFPLVKLLFCAAYSFVIRGQKISDFLLFFKVGWQNHINIKEIIC